MQARLRRQDYAGRVGVCIQPGCAQAGDGEFVRPRRVVAGHHLLQGREVYAHHVQAVIGVEALERGLAKTVWCGTEGRAEALDGLILQLYEEGELEVHMGGIDEHLFRGRGTGCDEAERSDAYP